MIKIQTLFLITFLAAFLAIFTGCASRDGGSGDDTTTPDAGSATTVDASSGDEFPSGNYEQASCYTSYEGGKEMTKCLKKDVPLAVADVTNILGYCGDAQNYEDNPIVGIDLGDRIAFQNDESIGLADGNVCEFSWGGFDANHHFVYAQYPDSTMSKSRAGELRECGNRTYKNPDGTTYQSYRCAMFEVRVAGHRAKPYGSYPTTPVIN